MDACALFEQHAILRIGPSRRGRSCRPCLVTAGGGSRRLHRQRGRGSSLLGEAHHPLAHFLQEPLLLLGDTPYFACCLRRISFLCRSAAFDYSSRMQPHEISQLFFCSLDYSKSEGTSRAQPPRRPTAVLPPSARSVRPRRAPRASRRSTPVIRRLLLLAQPAARGAEREPPTHDGPRIAPPPAHSTTRPPSPRTPPLCLRAAVCPLGVAFMPS